MRCVSLSFEFGSPTPVSSSIEMTKLLGFQDVGHPSNMTISDIIPN